MSLTEKNSSTVKEEEVLERPVQIMEQTSFLSHHPIDIFYQYKRKVIAFIEAIQVIYR